MTRASSLLLAVLGCVGSAHAASTFTPVTVEAGVQALRDGKPEDWWLSGLSFVDLDHDGETSTRTVTSI